MSNVREFIMITLLVFQY